MLRIPETRGQIVVRVGDEANAERLLRAVQPDDDEFVHTRRDGGKLVADVRGRDAKSLLRAADDFLACLSVAEDVMNGPPMGPPNA